MIQQTIITGHTASISTVIFSQDSLTLASESQDGSVRLWDIDYLWYKSSSNKSLLVTWMSEDAKNSSSISQDGNILAVGSEYGVVRLWNLSRSWSIAQLRPSSGYKWPHTKDINIDSVYGHDLVARADRNTIVLLDLTIKTEILLLIGHTYMVESLIFNTDKHTLMSLSRDDAICIWDLSLFYAMYQNYLARSIADNIPKLEWQFGYTLDGLKLRSYPYHESNSRDFISKYINEVG